MSSQKLKRSASDHDVDINETKTKKSKPSTPSTKKVTKSYANYNTTLSTDKKERKKHTHRPKPEGYVKKPLSSYMLFMQDFRITYKNEHPNENSATKCGSAGGAAWNNMTDIEKQVYKDKSKALAA